MKTIFRSLKSFIYIFVVIGTLFSYINCQSVSAEVLGNNNTLTLGSYVSFGGKIWRLIGDNYLMLDQKAIDSGYCAVDIYNSSTIYSPYYDGNVAYYLNNSFYNTLGTDAGLIQNWNWKTGNDANESLTIASCKVGLISNSEWNNVKTYIGNKPFKMWTRTRPTEYLKMWYIDLNGSLQTSLCNGYYGLYPTIHLKPIVNVSGGTGTIDNPYVIVEAPVNTIPTISVITPTVNNTYNATNNIISLSGQVKGATVGNTLKVYYRIDGNAEQVGTQVGADIISDCTNQSYAGNIDVSTLSAGKHILNAWVEEISGRKSCEIPITFAIASYKAKLGDSSTVTLGSYVTLGGKTWRVVGDNYLMADRIDSNSRTWVIDTKNPSTIFNPYYNGNIAYYINNSFYNTLGTDAGLIQNWNWETGTDVNESLTTASSKVGLISYSEWNNVKKYLEDKNLRIWTRTRGTSIFSLWYIDLNGSLQTCLYDQGYGVYPTIHLKPIVNISGGTGTSDNPYVIVEAPINTIPTISVITPTVNNTYNATNNIISLTGQVKGATVGNTLKVYYRIDGNAEQVGIQVGADIISDCTNQSYAGNIDVSALSAGKHTLNVWVQEDSGRKSCEIPITFAIASYKANLGDNSTVTLGSYVTLGGKTWRVVGDNYLMADRIDSNSQYWPLDIKNPSTIFNPYYNGNVAYYLNNSFYNTLGIDAGLIQNWNWETGTNANESLTTASSKVGLISYSEWNNVKEYLEDKNFKIWTRTRGVSDWYLQYIDLNGNLQTCLFDSCYGVYPTIHLKPIVNVSGGTGTSDNPYVIVEAPVNTIPTISVITPIVNNTYNAINNIISLSGQVKGAAVGKVLKVYYRIDGNAEQVGTQVGADIISDCSNQSYVGNIDVSALSIGKHILYVWVEEDGGRKSCEIPITFAIASYKSKVGDNSTVTLGSYVTLGGKTWRVIGDNYLMADRIDSNSQYWPLDTKNPSTIFNPYYNSNVAYYLNNPFYNTLGMDAGLIQNWNWETGTDANESLTTASCKVGLISNKEWSNVKTYLDDKNFRIWTRIRSTSDWILCFIDLNGNLQTCIFDPQRYGVYPTIHLKPIVNVSGGTGTIDNPYIIVEAPINTIPTISVITPTVNNTYNAINNIISLTGQVKGTSIGKVLKVYYRIDGNAEETGIEAANIIDNGIAQNYSYSIDVSAIAEGRHTLNVWVEEVNGRKSCEIPITFAIASYEPKLGDNNTVMLGSYVTLGGKTWRVIGDNYLMLDRLYANIKYRSSFDASYKVIYDPIDNTTVAYNLNNAFYNSLGTDVGLIQNWNWTNGTHLNESGTTTSCKIGMISFGEWKNSKRYLEDKNFRIWTRTQTTNIYQMWFTDLNGALITKFYDQASGVYPTIHLKPGTNVLYGTGEAGAPYKLIGVSFDPNGGEIKPTDKVTITAFDTSEAISALYYKWDNESYTSVSGASTAVLPPSGGKHTLYAYASNAKGDKSSVVSADYTVAIIPTIISITPSEPVCYGKDVSLDVTGTDITQSAYRIYYTTDITEPSVDATENAAAPGAGWVDSGFTGSLTVKDSATVSGIVPGTNITDMTWTYIVFKVAVGSESDDWVWKYSKPLILNINANNNPNLYIGNIEHNQIIKVNGEKVILSNPDTPNTDYGPYCNESLIKNINTFLNQDHVTYRIEFDALKPSDIKDMKIDLYFVGGIDIDINSIQLQKQQGDGKFAVIKNLNSSCSKNGVGRYSVLLGNDNSGDPMISANGIGRYAIEYTGKITIPTFVDAAYPLEQSENITTMDIYTAGSTSPFTLQIENPDRKFYIDTKVYGKSIQYR